MNLTKGNNSWVRCWGMSRMGSGNWISNRMYSGNWRVNSYCFFEVTKFNGRYRSMHWRKII